MRLSFAVAFAVALALSYGQGDGSRDSSQGDPSSALERHKQAVIRINDLAGRIHSEADASAYVSEIAVLFAKELPSVWAPDEILHRIARLEFDAVATPPNLVPEQRIVEVWNQYVREIGGPPEAIVNAAEIHNMRDAQFTVAQRMWSRGFQTAWTMPNIFAIGPNGKVADGCRAVEAVRIFHDLDQSFQNLISARDRAREGVLVSDKVKESSSGQKPHSRLDAQLVARTNLMVRPAEQRYLQEHGTVAYELLIKQLFDELFPPQ
jgi:hypothetical protein